jgi:hypothetical protein
MNPIYPLDLVEETIKKFKRGLIFDSKVQVSDENKKIPRLLSIKIFLLYCHERYHYIFFLHLNKIIKNYLNKIESLMNLRNTNLFHSRIFQF